MNNVSNTTNSNVRKVKDTRFVAMFVWYFWWTNKRLELFFFIFVSNELLFRKMVVIFFESDRYNPPPPVSTSSHTHLLFLLLLVAIQLFLLQKERVLMGGFPSPAQAPALIIDCPRPFPAAIGQIPQEIHQHTESVSRNFYQALQVFYNP